MVVGKYKATVVCKNKRDGKQRAAQAILKAMHPNIKSWGALLQLYGNHSVKGFKEKKMEEQEITLLQSKAAVNSPNFAILNKLKTEMRKLERKRIGLPENEENEMEQLGKEEFNPESGQDSLPSTSFDSCCPITNNIPSTSTGICCVKTNNAGGIISNGYLLGVPPTKSISDINPFPNHVTTKSFMNAFKTDCPDSPTQTSSTSCITKEEATG